MINSTIGGSSRNFPSLRLRFCSAWLVPKPVIQPEPTFAFPIPIRMRSMITLRWASGPETTTSRTTSLQTEPPLRVVKHALLKARSCDPDWPTPCSASMKTTAACCPRTLTVPLFLRPALRSTSCHSVRIL